MGVLAHVGLEGREGCYRGGSEPQFLIGSAEHEKSPEILLVLCFPQPKM